MRRIGCNADMLQWRMIQRPLLIVTLNVEPACASAALGPSGAPGIAAAHAGDDAHDVPVLVDLEDRSPVDIVAQVDGRGFFGGPRGCEVRRGERVRSARPALTVYPRSASAWIVIALRGVVASGCGVMSSLCRTDSRQCASSPPPWTGTLPPE